MEKGVCKFVDQNLWKYIDRELSARKVAEISAHLKECSSCSKLYESRSREATAYRLAFMGSPFGDEFEERFRERLVVDLADAPPRERGSDMLSILSRFDDKRAVLVIAALAIVVVTMFALTMYRFGRMLEAARHQGEIAGQPATQQHGEPALEAGREDRARPTTVVSDAPTLGSPGVDGGLGAVAFGSEAAVTVHAGRLYSGSSERGEDRIALADGSDLVFKEGPWSLYVSERSFDGSFFGEINEGSVEVSVTPRETSRPFVLTTPNAEVRVIGTRFTVSVVRGGPGGSLAGSTTLRVSEGVVSLTDLRTGHSQRVTPAEGAIVLDAPRADGSAGQPADGTPSTSDSPRTKIDLDSPVGVKRRP